MDDNNSINNKIMFFFYKILPNTKYYNILE